MSTNGDPNKNRASSQLTVFKRIDGMSDFVKIRHEEKLFDITFACDGGTIGAHKLVLFACSPYLKSLLEENPSQHPIFFMMEVKQHILELILDVMYVGMVFVKQEDVSAFQRVVKFLQIDYSLSNGSLPDSPIGSGVKAEVLVPDSNQQQQQEQELPDQHRGEVQQIEQQFDNMNLGQHQADPPVPTGSGVAPVGAVPAVPAEQQRLRCSHCPKTFKTEHTLIVHIRTYHTPVPHPMVNNNININI